MSLFGSVSLRTIRFVFKDERAPLLELPHSEAHDLLEWLGLGRPEFGALEVRVLLPLCRRRLWDVARNDDPSVVTPYGVRPAGTLRAMTGELAELVGRRPDGVVNFG